jgi:hypothetical protein
VALDLHSVTCIPFRGLYKSRLFFLAGGQGEMETVDSLCIVHLMKGGNRKKKRREKGTKEPQQPQEQRSGLNDPYYIQTADLETSHCSW